MLDMQAYNTSNLNPMFAELGYESKNNSGSINLVICNILTFSFFIL